MKIKTKLLTAVLATATAFSCALTAAAATTPTITLHGNEATPAVAADGETVTLSLKASGFNVVAGADLELTLGTGISLSVANVKISDKEIESTKYKVNDNTLRIIDVFNMTGAKQVTSLDLDITVNVGASDKIGRYDFSCTKAQLVYTEKTDNKYETVDVDVENSVNKANLVVGKKTETKDFNENKNYDDENQFLPYGVLYTIENGKKVYYIKSEEGNFTEVSKNQTITRFIKPLNNDVTTFGASKIEEKTAIQFGSYVDSIANDVTEFGTLVIAPYDVPTDNDNYSGCEKGSFDGVVEYYKNKSPETYTTTDDVLAHLVELLVNNGKDDGKFHALKYDSSKVIFLSVVKQNNYMWKNTNNTKLQYAVQYSGLNEKQIVTDYTAIGYYRVGNNAADYNFSTEIKTAQYETLGQAQ